jgi:hypothetical protein
LDQLVEQSLQGLQLLGAQLLHGLLEALGQRHGPPFLGNNILAQCYLRDKFPAMPQLGSDLLERSRSAYS